MKLLSGIITEPDYKITAVDHSQYLSKTIHTLNEGKPPPINFKHTDPEVVRRYTPRQLQQTIKELTDKLRKKNEELERLIRINNLREEETDTPTTKPKATGVITYKDVPIINNRNKEVSVTVPEWYPCPWKQSMVPIKIPGINMTARWPIPEGAKAGDTYSVNLGKLLVQEIVRIKEREVEDNQNHTVILKKIKESVALSGEVGDSLSKGVEGLPETRVLELERMLHEVTNSIYNQEILGLIRLEQQIKQNDDEPYSKEKQARFKELLDLYQGNVQGLDQQLSLTDKLWHDEMMEYLESRVKDPPDDPSGTCSSMGLTRLPIISKRLPAVPQTRGPTVFPEVSTQNPSYLVEFQELTETMAKLSEERKRIMDVINTQYSAIIERDIEQTIEETDSKIQELDLLDEPGEIDETKLKNLREKVKHLTKIIELLKVAIKRLDNPERVKHLETQYQEYDAGRKIENAGAEAMRRKLETLTGNRARIEEYVELGNKIEELNRKRDMVEKELGVGWEVVLGTIADEIRELDDKIEHIDQLDEPVKDVDTKIDYQNQKVVELTKIIDLLKVAKRRMGDPKGTTGYEKEIQYQLDAHKRAEDERLETERLKASLIGDVDTVFPIYIELGEQIKKLTYQRGIAETLLGSDLEYIPARDEILDIDHLLENLDILDKRAKDIDEKVDYQKDKINALTDILELLKQAQVVNKRLESRKKSGVLRLANLTGDEKEQFIKVGNQLKAAINSIPLPEGESIEDMLSKSIPLEDLFAHLPREILNKIMKILKSFNVKDIYGLKDLFFQLDDEARREAEAEAAARRKAEATARKNAEAAALRKAEAEAASRRKAEAEAAARRNAEAEAAARRKAEAEAAARRKAEAAARRKAENLRKFESARNEVDAVAASRGDTLTTALELGRKAGLEAFEARLKKDKENIISKVNKKRRDRQSSVVARKKPQVQASDVLSTTIGSKDNQRRIK